MTIGQKVFAIDHYGQSNHLPPVASMILASLILAAIVMYLVYLITRPIPVHQQTDEEVWNELYVPPRVLKLERRDVLNDVDSLYVGGVTDEDSDEYPIHTSK